MENSANLDFALLLHGNALLHSWFPLDLIFLFIWFKSINASRKKINENHCPTSV